MDEQRQQTPGRVPDQVTRTVEALRIDLVRLHATWMGLVVPPEHRSDHSVVESWKPRTTRGAVGNQLWAAVGVLLLTALYPLYVLGLATRFYTRRIDRTSAGLGFFGVVLVSLVAWGALTAATYVSPIAYGGFLAVAAAGVVATLSAVLALYFTRREGRLTTVALGYPFGMTAVFLPPVIASLYSPTLAAIVLPRSESLAIWILDNVLDYGGVAAFIRASFDLEGLAYVGMWFGLAVPTGWVLGIVVTLTYAVRPSGTSNTVEEARG